MAEPARANAGDTLSWSRSLPLYPAPTWTLRYYLAKAAETPLVVTAAASGSDHAVTVPATTTAGWPAGRYNWTARVTDGTTTVTVDSGQIEILPDPSTAVDRRTHNQKCLDAITAMIEGRIADPVTEYEINGVKAKRLSPLELPKLRAIYALKVRQEQGMPSVRTIPVRLGRV